MRRVFVLVTCLVCFCTSISDLQAGGPFKVARLQYDGGGDWYNNPDVIPNLMDFARDRLNIDVEPEQTVLEATDDELFQYPLLYLTGHGRIDLSDAEARNLRNYALSGGLIYIDDDFGMDEHVRPEIQKIFPDRALQQLSADHALFSRPYSFRQIPRIHEHDPDKPPRTFGIRAEGEWVLIYSFNTNFSDGWASPEVHGDPPEIREQALRWGVNLISLVLSP